MGTIVTSIKVDEDLWKSLKKAAIDMDLSLQDATDDALRKWLNKR